ncbi:hypothetical protein [Candidatus Villigracilis affinis]|uniref:hypothetical protein n=1 Tax=Candidatus Villigracilis affinis TaxID=3140682 RepID=UPI002A1ACC6B|nr:hypothetical protein [Anaerolineales bacterium]
MKDSKNISWIAVFFAILTVLILVGIVWKGYGLGYIPARHMENPDILLPILISVSAVGLLISLAFLAVSFSALELSDRNQALGLPEGSVRALIALLLIILFVVISIYLYGRLRSPVGSAIYKEYIGISEAQLDAIPEAEVISIRVRTEGEEKTFNVTRRIPPSEGKRGQPEVCRTSAYDHQHAGGINRRFLFWGTFGGGGTGYRNAHLHPCYPQYQPH